MTATPNNFLQLPVARPALSTNHLARLYPRLARFDPPYLRPTLLAPAMEWPPGALFQAAGRVYGHQQLTTLGAYRLRSGLLS